MGAARRGRRWRRSRTVLVALVALLLIGGGGAFALTRQSSSSTTAPRTVAASLQTLEQSVTSTGTIEPATEADLSFQQSGTVQTVPVAVGQHVRKGQTLATIGSSTLSSQVTLAQAQVTQAQAQVTAASGGTATQVASANAQLAAAQAKLSSAQSALGQASLVSPIDGVVASVNIAVGSNVGAASSGASSAAGRSGASGGGGAGGGSGGNGGLSAGSGSGTGSSSADISVITTNAWVVDATVTSTDLPSLKPGLEVQILPTGTRQPIFGTVSSVGLVATSSSSGAAQFPVTIAVTGHPTGLYAGTTASVSIVVRQLQNVLAVPTAAIRTSGGQTVVTVLSGTRQVTTPVTLGQIFGAQTQVTAGLTVGQQVVLPTTLGRGGGTAGTTGTGGAGRTFNRTGGFGGGGFGGGGFGGGGGSTGARNGG